MLTTAHYLEKERRVASSKVGFSGEHILKLAQVWLLSAAFNSTVFKGDGSSASNSKACALHSSLSTQPSQALTEPLHNPGAAGPSLYITQSYAKGLQAAKDNIVHGFTR